MHSSHTLMSASHTLMSASNCGYVHASIILPRTLQILHLQRVYSSYHLIRVRHGSPENTACFFTPNVPLKFVGRRLTHSSQIICSSKKKICCALTYFFKKIIKFIILTILPLFFNSCEFFYSIHDISSE